MKKTFIAACGSGLGSSLIISMNISKVLQELGIEGNVEHCDISSLTFKDGDYYVLGKDVAESSAVGGIDKNKIIVLTNILSLNELKEKIIALNLHTR
ncbi:MAG: PTS sugar transporter subunit IIB [Brevinemataceae bacterium]